MAEYREYGITVATGLQGVGKSHHNREAALQYVLDNPQTRKRGRKVLIYNSANDHIYSPFPCIHPHDLHLQPDKTIFQVKAIHPNGTHMGSEDKKKLGKYLMQNFSDGLFIFEDFANCMVNVSDNEIIGLLTTLRHKTKFPGSGSGTDILVSIQNIEMVPAGIWRNISYYRFHKQTTTIDNCENFAGDKDLYRIAEIIVNENYNKAVLLEEASTAGKIPEIPEEKIRAAKSFFCWIDTKKNRLSGPTDRQVFIDAAAKLVRSKPGLINRYLDENGMRRGNQQHIQEATRQLVIGYLPYFKAIA